MFYSHFEKWGWTGRTVGSSYIGCDGSEEDDFADSCNVTASAKTKCETKKGPMDKFCR